MREEEIRELIDKCLEEGESACSLVRKMAEALRAKGREEEASVFLEISSKVCPEAETAQGGEEVKGDDQPPLRDGSGEGSDQGPVL